MLLNAIGSPFRADQNNPLSPFGSCSYLLSVLPNSSRRLGSGLAILMFGNGIPDQSEVSFFGHVVSAHTVNLVNFFLSGLENLAVRFYRRHLLRFQSLCRCRFIPLCSQLCLPIGFLLFQDTDLIMNILLGKENGTILGLDSVTMRFIAVDVLLNLSSSIFQIPAFSGGRVISVGILVSSNSPLHSKNTVVIEFIGITIIYFSLIEISGHVKNLLSKISVLHKMFGINPKRLVI